jgi:hypothetical protein
MKSILSLWQQYNHINKLIGNRKETLASIHGLKEGDLDDVLKSEFGEAFPPYWVRSIIHPLAADMVNVGNFDSYDVRLPNEFFTHAVIILNNLCGQRFEIALEPTLGVTDVNKREVILSYLKPNNKFDPTPLNIDWTAKDLLALLSPC